MVGPLAALAAALSWTLASSLWRSLTTSLSALQLNGLKNTLAVVLFLPVLVALPWRQQPGEIGLLLLSGGVGIALGDSFYLAALRRLGTRRTLTIEALAPLLASVGGVALMGEPIRTTAWLGGGLVTASVLLVARQRPPDRELRRDATDAGQRLGVLCALAAVLCGVAGAALSRLVLAGGAVAPLQSSAVRLLGGAVLLLPWFAPGMALRPGPRPARRRWPRVLAATLLGTNLGILLQQLVFRELPLGPGVTLLSTAPVMALALAGREGDHPRLGGVAASLLSVLGISLAVM